MNTGSDKEQGMSERPREKRSDDGFQPVSNTVNSLMKGLFANMSHTAPDESKDTAPTLEVAHDKTSQPRTQLSRAAAEIAARPPDKDKGEIVYTMRELVQCNFPIRDPGNVPAWTRKNGNLTLIIQPGINPETGQSFGFPRGEWPRLFMRFFQKQVVTTKRPIIKLGSTTNEVIRATGGSDMGRGKRSDAKRMLTELERLIYARISCFYTEGTAQHGRRGHLDMPVSKMSETWWDYRNPDQPSLFTSEIILGDVLFQAFLNDPIPVDLRVLLALKRELNQSAFAMDIYDWRQLHLYRMRQQGQPDLKIQWRYLPDQFGAEFTRARAWKAAFEENLFHVEALSPSLTHEFEGDYLILRDTGAKAGLVLPTRRRMERLANQITPKAREWFLSQFPLHASNLSEIETAFNDWRQEKGIASRDPDKHFKHFVRYNWFKQPKPQGGD